MARAHEQLALDEAVTDQAAVVRARVLDDDDIATLEPRNRDPPRAITRRDDPAYRNEADIV